MTTAADVLPETAKPQGDDANGAHAREPPGFDARGSPAQGIASRYVRDRGIGRDPDVLMAESFESATWWDDWTPPINGFARRVGDDAGYKFAALEGAALRVDLPRGDNYGVDMRYKFASRGQPEPEEVYFRYYLRFGDDWNPSTDGGKLPGISATYGKAGWGGRKAVGDLGWSMRGAFFRRPGPGTPAHDYTPIGTYAYHLDTDDVYGDSWPWSIGERGLLARNRWYCIEQYMKVNTPGRKDAILRAWVDGRPALEKTGFRVRTVDWIKIEEIWVNVYYGGTAPSPQDQHLFIDNVVIARRYIGPMQAP